MDFHPDLWGPAYWSLLHMITISYPIIPTDENKEHYGTFFNNLLLPCSKCLTDYKEQVTIFPIDDYLNSPRDLFNWIITIQNNINKRLKKPLVNGSKIFKSFHKENNCCCKRSPRLISNISTRWKIFNFIALSYSNSPTEEQQIKYKTFFHLLQFVLPCGKCKKNFRKRAKYLHIDEYLGNSFRLYMWIVKINIPSNTNFYSQIRRYYRDNAKAYKKKPMCCAKNREFQKKVDKFMLINSKKNVGISISNFRHIPTHISISM